MKNYQIYEDIKTRTNGDIYIGVVGPVRVGKSTFISSFMNRFVIPNIETEAEKVRAQDELPQSADGKTIMTTQPNFVPSQSASIRVAGADMRVRLIDCVGYLASGVLGSSEGGKPRLVKTPWAQEDMPFEEAAELGTKKVIAEHSTVGVVVTTDGSVTELGRQSYVGAEERVICEMKASGKPFVVALNCKNPSSNESKKLACALEEKYSVPVLAISALDLKEADVDRITGALLSQFPVKEVQVKMPRYLRALPLENDIIREVATELKKFGQGIKRLADVKEVTLFEQSDNFDPVTVGQVDAGDGTIKLSLMPKEDLFYHVLSSQCGREIEDDFALISLVKEFSVAKSEYDRLKDALAEVEETGYGVVAPRREDFELGAPELIRQGSRFGVKIKASAPSLHIMRVDVDTEVTPLVGSEDQSEDLVKNLQQQIEENPDSIWDTNILGRSLSSLIGDNIASKIVTMPAEAQKKMRKTLGRIVNEGRGGVICILL